ncbi:hypothetical protein BOTBODRAFT_29689 [Botryobasidium botryosum FD-172 SS1]|uniref:Uncharacterized protein n=1 Tax=Botryobasidium botryosum (strain FD-172 SS1) TaxID=930990 RepID=A0A067MP21_BOTB1|nr:hypothetical protein BOTBODRAFT_29689 [Botryobasidium botryosum FD-172 SS1]
MEENGASYAQALEVAGAGHAQMISAGDYSGAVIRPLLETLFGQDAFHQNHGHPGPSVPKPEYKSVAEALHYRMWERQVTQRERRERKAQWNADVDGATVTPDASAEYARPQPSTLGAPPNMNRKSEPGNEDQFNNSADAATIRTSASPFPPSFALSTPTSASASAPQLPLDFQQRPFVVLPPAVPPSVLSQIITNMNTRLLPADEFAYHFASCAGCGGVGTHRVVAEHQLDCVGSGTGEME